MYKGGQLLYQSYLIRPFSQSYLLLKMKRMSKLKKQLSSEIKKIHTFDCRLPDKEFLSYNKDIVHFALRILVCNEKWYVIIQQHRLTYFIFISKLLGHKVGKGGFVQCIFLSFVLFKTLETRAMSPQLSQRDIQINHFDSINILY